MGMVRALAFTGLMGPPVKRCLTPIWLTLINAPSTTVWTLAAAAARSPEVRGGPAHFVGRQAQEMLFDQAEAGMAHGGVEPRGATAVDLRLQRAGWRGRGCWWCLVSRRFSIDEWRLTRLPYCMSGISEAKLAALAAARAKRAVASKRRVPKGYGSIEHFLGCAREAVGSARGAPRSWRLGCG